MKINLRLNALALALCLALAACTGQPQIPVLGGEIADLHDFPQDLTVYAQKAGDTKSLLTPQKQQEQWERYKRLYFAPWQKERAAVTTADAFAPLKQAGYTENLLPRSSADMQGIVRNSNQATYPNRKENERYAVTVRDTALRAAPTVRPLFNNPQKAGQGYPFDMWQYATFPIGMPLYVTHTSTDGAWVLVETALVSGWVAEADIALVDTAFMQAVRSLPMLAVLREHVVLTDPASSRIVAQASIGALLPESGTYAGKKTVLMPVRDVRGMANAVFVHVPETMTAAAPMTFTPAAYARIGNELMGQPYGWGSLYQNRDCSAMLRDLFTPFGIWLPRNSAAQAKAWPYTDFEGFAPDMKEQQLLAQAKPFVTLISFPGHIALYVGEHQGRAAMFHDMWGVRTENNTQEGRYIVGRVLVSSTRPGAELSNVQDPNTLLARVRGIATLP